MKKSRQLLGGGIRGSVAAGLAIALLLLVIGTALAVVATMNLNLAATEEFNTRAEELARSGINQFLADLEKSYVDYLAPSLPVPAGVPAQDVPGYTTPLDTMLAGAFQIPPTDFPPSLPPPPNAAQRQAALTDATGTLNYPMPWSHLEGYCYITFNPASKYPYSTWNCNDSQPLPTQGYSGRSVPAYSIDLICTARIGSHVRHLACRVTRRWDYAVACAQQIFISSTPDFPTRVYGDVYTRNAPTDSIFNVRIHEGWEFACTPCNGDVGAATTGTVVRGHLIDTSPDPKSIQVAAGNTTIGWPPTVPSVTNPGRCDFKLVHFPYIENLYTGLDSFDPSGNVVPTVSQLDATWTNLANYTGSLGHSGLCGTINYPATFIPGTAPYNAYLLQDPNAPAGACAPAPGAPGSSFLMEFQNKPPANTALTLGPNGKFWLAGNLVLDPTTPLVHSTLFGNVTWPVNPPTGIKLNKSVLYLVSVVTPAKTVFGGSLVMDKGPSELVGISSCLICDGDLAFKWGFVESDIGSGGGFVVRANKIFSEAGGDFRGLVLAKAGMYLGSLDTADLGGGNVCCGYIGPHGVQMASLEGGGQGDGCFCLGICPDICAPCGAKAPVCAGTYAIGHNPNISTGNKNVAVPTHPAAITPASEAAFLVAAPDLQGAAPEAPYVAGPPPSGVPAVPAEVTTGPNAVFPLRVTGAILAPYGVDPNTDYAFWLRSVLVKWDPQYLDILHRQAPIATENWEVVY